MPRLPTCGNGGQRTHASARVRVRWARGRSPRVLRSASSTTRARCASNRCSPRTGSRCTRARRACCRVGISSTRSASLRGSSSSARARPAARRRPARRPPRAARRRRRRRATTRRRSRSARARPAATSSLTSACTARPRTARSTAVAPRSLARRATARLRAGAASQRGTAALACTPQRCARTPPKRTPSPRLANRVPSRAAVRWRAFSALECGGERPRLHSHFPLTPPAHESRVEPPPPSWWQYTHSALPGAPKRGNKK
mmetsp:Transcript_471/g.1208  ORF Transcript_471/g.1208 Transcript_471/m.1208 type:complete len:259 (+) Transcript_471:1140-1916(+)